MSYLLFFLLFCITDNPFWCVSFWSTRARVHYY